MLEDTKDGVRWKTEMKFETKVVHSGDRKRTPPKGVPVHYSLFIWRPHTSTTSRKRWDRIFGHEEEGPSYSRYCKPHQ